MSSNKLVNDIDALYEKYAKKRSSDFVRSTTGVPMGQFALRWILIFDAVTCAIPGGKRPEQVRDNSHASDLPPLTDDTMAAVRRIYAQKILPLVEVRW